MAFFAESDNCRHESGFVSRIGRRRRIFSFLNSQAHQPEAGEIQDGRADEDCRRVAFRIPENEEVVQRRRDHRDDSEPRHETRQQFFRHDVVEEIPEYRINEGIEKAVDDHHERNDQHRELSRAESHRVFVDILVQPDPDAVGKTDAQQKEHGHRSGQENERDAPAPSAPVAVAFKADHRIEHGVYDHRDGRHDHSERRVGGTERLELQRHNTRHHRLHQHVAEIPPQQPAEKDRQRGFRIRQGADMISLRFVLHITLLLL